MNRTLEEILETIWKALEKGDARIETIRQNCPDTVMDHDLEILERRDLIVIKPDKVELTSKGEVVAKGVVRRHRLAESLFASILDLDEEKREEIACEVEHTLLPEVEEAICTLLGHPAICPDGKNIPKGRCCHSGRTSATAVVSNLTGLAPGSKGRITYIKPKDHSRLHRLTSFGLTPGTMLEVHQNFPAVCIRYEGTELAIDHDVAEDIFVAKLE